MEDIKIEVKAKTDFREKKKGAELKDTETETEDNMETNIKQKMTGNHITEAGTNLRTGTHPTEAETNPRTEANLGIEPPTIGTETGAGEEKEACPGTEDMTKDPDTGAKAEMDGMRKGKCLSIRGI